MKHPTPAPAAKHNGVHRGKLSPADLVKAAALWRDGMTAEKIGEQLGVGGTGIYYQASKRGWQRAPRGARTKLRDPGYTPSGAE